MNIGKVIKVIIVPDSKPKSIPVRDWPTRRPEERPVEVPNWPVLVPVKKTNE